MDQPWRTKSIPDGAACPATVEGERCGLPVKSLGLCSTHYQRQRDGRDMDAPIKRRSNEGLSCKGTVEGQPCTKPIRANGFCEGHRARWRTGKDMDAPWQYLPQPDECIVDGCSLRPTARSLCDMHYRRWLESGDPGPPGRLRRSTGEVVVCSVEGCDKLAPKGAWCAAHAKEEWRRNPRNREAEKAAAKRFYERNTERVKAEQAAYRKRTRDAKNAYMDAYRKDPANRDKIRAALMLVQARKRAQTILPFDPDAIAGRIDIFGEKCWMCGADFEHIDHVKPLAKGGAHTPANLRPACASCNQSKHAAWPIDTSTAHLRLDPARLP